MTPSRTCERTLGSLDQAMDMIEAFGLPDAKPLEQRKNDQDASPWVGGGELKAVPALRAN